MPGKHGSNGPGHPVVTDVMELKVIRDCRGRLDLRDLVVIRDFLVPRDLPVLKEIVDPGVLRDLKGHPNRCLIRTGKNASGET